jgi:hypothetical protein
MPQIYYSLAINVTCYFSAHPAKGNVSSCHHLASVVRRLLTFHILIFSSNKIITVLIVKKNQDIQVASRSGSVNIIFFSSQ